MVWCITGLLLYFISLLAEHALVAATPHDIQQLESRAAFLSGQALHQVRNLRSALSALLLSRLFLKVLVVVFGVYAFLQSAYYKMLEPDLVAAMGPTWLVQLLTTIALALVLSLVFWVLHYFPFNRVIGDQPERLLPVLSAFTSFWHFIFKPFVLKQPRQDAPLIENGNHGVSREKTGKDTMGVPLSSEKGDLELLRSIVKFSDVTVKQVMQPRNKIIAVDFRSNFHEIMEQVRASGFSRMPVFDEELDNITGLLYVKDLVEYLDQEASFEWQSLIRTEVLNVPESKRISELLEEFKQTKMHMAVVVDEYGGCSGIVTMEDVLEEVTGEIQDEFDEEEAALYRKMDEFTYLCSGQMLLNELCRVAGLAPDAFDEVRGNADTLAGLVLELWGDIPKPGSETEWNQYRFVVAQADKRKVEQVKVCLPQ